MRAQKKKKKRDKNPSLRMVYGYYYALLLLLLLSEIYLTRKSLTVQGRAKIKFWFYNLFCQTFRFEIRFKKLSGSETVVFPLDPVALKIIRYERRFNELPILIYSYCCRYVIQKLSFHRQRQISTRSTNNKHQSPRVSVAELCDMDNFE